MLMFDSKLFKERRERATLPYLLSVTESFIFDTSITEISYSSHLYYSKRYHIHIIRPLSNSGYYVYHII